ncbi:MAG: ABC transporter permease [Pseudoclavibacter sp.]
MNTTSARILAPISVAIAVLAVWWIVTAAGVISPQFLPAPGQLAERFWLDVTKGPMLAHAWVTLSAALLGSLLAIVVAVPLGYLIARQPWVDVAITPYVAASQAVPAIALAPLLVLWIGYGLAPTVVLCAIMSFFPMLVTTVLGVRQLPQDVIEAGRIDGANWYQLLWWVEGPLALPSVLAGIRAGVTLSITGAVVGEFTMGGRGLGMLLTLNRDANDIPGIFSTLLMLVLLAVTLYVCMRLFQNAVTWNDDEPKTKRRARVLADEPLPA